MNGNINTLQTVSDNNRYRLFNKRKIRFFPEINTSEELSKWSFLSAVFKLQIFLFSREIYTTRVIMLMYLYGCYLIRLSFVVFINAGLLY